MSRWADAALPLLLALALAGCLQPAGTGATARTPPSASPPWRATGTAGPLADGSDVAVAGTVTAFHGGFLANLSAHNAGPHPYGYPTYDCMSKGWWASLAGPPGENLTYRDPSAYRLGCPGQRSVPLPAGGWANWTATPGCNIYAACDNQWDGRLWDASGNAAPAPAGTYTWRFRFPYHDVDVVDPDDPACATVESRVDGTPRQVGEAAPGTYRIAYLRGAMRPTADPGKWQVQGFFGTSLWVTDAAGRQVAQAPGGFGPFASQAEVERNNAGALARLDWPGGAMSLAFQDGDFSDNVAGDPAPTFQVCPVPPLRSHAKEVAFQVTLP
ncbi:MAG: hypothetical protein LC623_01215 [Halobacteriales archaeon]|nr:hypothetical protein [Halobacteriales archaeon]